MITFKCALIHAHTFLKKIPILLGCFFLFASALSTNEYPQLLQNFALPASAAPHCGQFFVSSHCVPHSGQNFPSNSVPHLKHLCIVTILLKSFSSEQKKSAPIKERSAYCPLIVATQFSKRQYRKRDTTMPIAVLSFASIKMHIKLCRKDNFIKVSSILQLFQRQFL